MNREETIEQLENLLGHCESMANRDSHVWDADCQALKIAIAALRPVSREQMEKVWGSIWLHAIPVLGAGDVKIHCAKCGNVVKQETDFCPYCGLAMTPEAMEIVEKRMEEKSNG